MEHAWRAWCERPSGLVAPVPVDPFGSAGPTPDQARGPRWRRTSSNRYVPSEVDESVVEQRILEQGCRIRGYGAVTGWAALRWQGGTFFDGTTDSGTGRLPVLLNSHTKLSPDTGFIMTQEQLAPTEWTYVGGIPVATIQRALFDEVRRRPGVRDAANAISMAAAAWLISRRLFAAYVDQRHAWTGVPHARLAVALAHDECRSPQEFLMYVVWKLDAALPEPLLNRAVYDLDGRLIGIPDLFDPVAGLAGEYQGEHHKSGAQHRRDVERDARFRDHGIETFEVVGGELGRRMMVAARMLDARRRAKFLPPESRAWTLEVPPWRTPPEPLDTYLSRTGAADRLWRT